MDGQDQRAIVGNGEIGRADRHPLRFQPRHFIAQGPGIEHHPVADDRQRAGDDARRQQAELVGLVTNDQRMAGIVPALKAHDGVGATGQPVDNLALALIAPLGADDGYVCHE